MDLTPLGIARQREPPLTTLAAAPTLGAMSDDAPRETVETPTGTSLNARVTISLYEPQYEGGDLIPIIEVTPAGRMTLGAIDRLLPKIYQEINRAQGLKGRADELAVRELADG